MKNLMLVLFSVWAGFTTAAFGIHCPEPKFWLLAIPVTGFWLYLNRDREAE